jgi:hypothetical protein
MLLHAMAGRLERSNIVLEFLTTVISFNTSSTSVEPGRVRGRRRQIRAAIPRLGRE